MARCRLTALLTLLVLAAAAPAAQARVAFVSERDGEPEIYVMADDGAGQRDLTNDPAAPDVAPAWSPDGTHIAYQRGYGPDGDIWVMGDDGSAPHALIDADSGESAPTWAPDGRHIAFVSDRSGEDGLYVAAADGTGARRLDTGDADPSDPAYSPDGASIAYWDSDAQLIRVIRPDGTGDHAVGGPPDDALGGDQTPAWTPDGTHLVFASLRDLASSYDIWEMGLDGDGQRALTSSPDREIDPSVAGDGHVYYASDEPGNYAIYAMDADGGGATQLTSSDGDDTAPAWAPGGAPLSATSVTQGAPSSSPASPSQGAGRAKTPLRVRVSYDDASIRVSAHRVVVRLPYRLNRAATVTVHLYLRGRLRASFTHSGRPGANVATWEHRIASQERWRGAYTVAVVRASEPAAG